MAVAIVGTLVPATSAARFIAAPRHRRCDKLFTVRMGQRAGRAVYGGEHPATLHQLRVLGYIERCQRNPAAQWYVRWYDRHQAQLNAARRAQAARPWASAYASDYDDSGRHCCGVYATYGVADQGAMGYGPPQGTRIELCYRRCVVATVDDHGPYAGARELDLALSTADAVGFSGLGTVRWRLAG